MLRGRERQKKRYAEDLEYRERTLAYNRAYNAAHKAELNKRRRDRRRTDPEYRERCLAGRRGDRARNTRLKFSYGISTDDYDALLGQQNGICAICETQSEQTLCVDHCHSTGMVRGLLCRKCNLGLGYYDDEPRLLLKAIAYLKRSRRIAETRKKEEKPVGTEGTSFKWPRP